MQLIMRNPPHSPDAEVEDVCEECDADAGAGAGHHLDELPPPLEVLRQHHRRRLPHHRVAHAEQQAVAELKEKEEDLQGGPSGRGALFVDNEFKVHHSVNSSY